MPVSLSVSTGSSCIGKNWPGTPFFRWIAIAIAVLILSLSGSAERHVPQRTSLLLFVKTSSDASRWRQQQKRRHMGAVSSRTPHQRRNSALSWIKSCPRRPNSSLYSRPEDNLVSGVAEISFACSLGVLWSEYSIISTGCGPANFSDALERICYQGVIASAGVALFLRIVTGGDSLETTVENALYPLEGPTLIQVRIAEYFSALSVLGAFVSLGYQSYVRGANMEGLSGIDVSMCRAIQDLL